jgi:hypothetical protein
MSNSKIDLIIGAYDRLRISGITVNPGARENAKALRRLETMAARWFDRNICSGYNFEDNPDLNSDSGIPPKYQDAFESNLAVALSPDYGKEPSAGLLLEQRATLSQISSSTAVVDPVNYPTRQPRGSGNRLYDRWNRFYTPQPEAPNECETNNMLVDDVDDFTEHFDSYLRGSETIISYLISADTGITIVSSSLASPDINYRIKADDSTDAINSQFLMVRIKATTSTGRVEQRVVNFSVVGSALTSGVSGPLIMNPGLIMAPTLVMT